MPSILVVDDDPAIREMVRMALTRAGYDILEAGSALEARQIIASRKPDLILLDWMLPGQSGFEFARQLHSDNAHPPPSVIMLTARDQEADKIAALDAGADDYVSKPFSVSELLARIKAVLRRTTQHDNKEQLEIDGIRLDPGTCRVTAGEAPVELSPLEFRLLHFFITHRERVYSRQQLIEQVWDTAHVEDRTVDVHIRRLRKILGPSGHDRFIQTVRSVGYRFSTHD
jgi:two-component system phosphate regulon response regulator PhoB